MALLMPDLFVEYCIQMLNIWKEIVQLRWLNVLRQMSQSTIAHCTCQIVMRAQAMRRVDYVLNIRTM